MRVLRPLGWRERLWCLFLPARCLCCGRAVRPERLFCPGCVPALPKEPLSREFPLPGGGSLAVAACFPYEKGFRRTLHRLKFQEERALARPLGTLMAEAASSLGEELDGVTWVPMSPQKLRRRGFEVSVESMKKNLDDVAGIRIICSFVDDIYEVAEMLVRQDDVKVIAVKDYIKNPKDNGYRSYHMIIEMPVFFSQCKRSIRVEVQIRTIAMDFWASLDHQLKYKKEIADDPEITAELKQCADVIAQTDEKMLAIRKKIEARGIAVRRD